MAETIVERARRIADELLAPAASAVDRGGAVPRAHLDALADAGLYGLGVEDDFATACAAVEALASGCLTTTFVWTQHLGVLQTVLHAAPATLRDAWLEPLAAGARRAGVSFTSSLPGAAPLTARADEDGGWRFDGVAPWVSGWERIDVLHAAARTGDDRIVWALVDTDGLPAERLRLLAVDASNTVRVRFDGVRVGADRVTQVTAFDPAGPVRPPNVRVHGALVLGLIDRCRAIVGPSPLDDAAASARAEMDGALEDAERMALARAAVSELALRAAAAALVSVGARGAAAGTDVERLGREALFLSVFGLRAPIRAALLDRLENDAR